MILIVFHHLNEHKCQIRTPTDKRISDRSLLDHCLGVVDVVFWNKVVYDCEANAKAMEEMRELLRWNVAYQDKIEMMDFLET